MIKFRLIEVTLVAIRDDMRQYPSLRLLQVLDSR
jgi:hypothetical protein